MDVYVRERMRREALGLPVAKAKSAEEVKAFAKALESGEVSPEELEARVKEWFVLPEKNKPKQPVVLMTNSGISVDVSKPIPVPVPEEPEPEYEERKRMPVKIPPAALRIDPPQTEEIVPFVYKPPVQDNYSSAFRAADVQLGSEAAGDFGFPVVHAQLIDSPHMGRQMLLVYDTSSNVYFVPRVSRPGKPPLPYEVRVRFNDAKDGGVANFGQFVHLGFEYKIGRLLHILLLEKVDEDPEMHSKQGDVREDTPDLRPAEAKQLQAEWDDATLKARQDEVVRVAAQRATYTKASAVESVAKTLGE